MDEQIFRTLQPALLSLLDESIWALITSKALPLVILAAAAFWAHRNQRWKTLAICVALGLLGESISSHLIKPFLAVPRPCRLEGMSLLSRCSWTYSMPSSHAVSITAGLVPLALHWRRAAPWLAVAALLFILSRAALGMHWPSDLFVGALLGSAIGFTGYQLQKRTTAR
jgi:undecaprenyl-diphosphatase